MPARPTSPVTFADTDIQTAPPSHQPAPRPAAPKVPPRPKPLAKPNRAQGVRDERALYPASFARVFTADLIDSALVLPLCVGAAFSMFLAIDATPVDAPTQLESVALRIVQHPVVFTVFLVATLALSTLYQFIVPQLLEGTVGQRLLGIRTATRSEGKPMGSSRRLLRAFFSSLGIIALLAGPLFAWLIDPLQRGLGDLFTRTLPIRAPFMGSRNG